MVKWLSAPLAGLIIFVAQPVFAQNFEERAPVSIIDSVAKLIVDPKNGRDRFGSGFFVDFTGCLLTNAHVATNFEKNHQVREIEVARPINYRRKPEVVGNAKLVWVDPKIDIAVVCLDTTDFYPELKIADAQAVESLIIGDILHVVGFAKAGSESVTFSQSRVIGFWDEPDVKQISGADPVDPKRINLIKIDGVTGMGSSGSPVLNQKNQVVGVMFAGQSVSAVPGLAIDAKTFENWEEKVLNSRLPAPGCIFDPLFNSYSRDGLKYYDNQCFYQRDPNIESLVTENYQTRCGVKPETKIIEKASRHIRKGSTIDKWFEYLKKICPSPVTPFETQTLSASKKSPATSALSKSEVKPSSKITGKKPAGKKLNKPLKGAKPEFKPTLTPSKK